MSTGLTGLLLAVLALRVARRSGTAAGVSLAVLLITVAWWGVAYAAELAVGDLGAKAWWGNLKYVGVVGLAPALLAFVLQYTGREQMVTRRFVAALAVEPVAVMVLLYLPPTHRLVRYYEPLRPGETQPVVGSGPVFWFHLAYSNVIVLVATVLFVVSMVRLSRVYLRMAVILVLAALLPWVGNLLYNFVIPPFETVDPTPFAFTITGAVLVWGVLHERLVNLRPLARDELVDHMDDALVVSDALGRVVDVNPSGAQVLGLRRGDLLGRSLTDVLPGLGQPLGSGAGAYGEVQLETGEGPRAYELRVRPLRVGDRPAGQMLVLHDVTQRRRDRERLQELLEDRSRVAAALQTSLTPESLPEIPGVELASRFEPAGTGTEIGGDFFDVFPLGSDLWGLMLGDVSGKGARAAAMTAQVRYSLRALAAPGRSPSDTLRALNEHLLATTPVEMHATLVFAVLDARGPGVELMVSLAGHHPPMLLRGTGEVVECGEPGTVAGLFADPQLHDAPVTLGPGDLLCLFTDGLVEARREGAQFGSERALDVLGRYAGAPADAVVAALAGAVHEFAGPHLADDLALLALRVRPGSG